MASISFSKWKQVVKLYRSGLSMREIANQFHVPIGAIIYVLRKLSEPRRTATETNKIIFDKKLPSFAIVVPRTPFKKNLEAMGAMLYWAEGYKTIKAKGIDFANSDSTMILLFIHFLRSRYILDEKRLRVSLYCHENQNSRELITYWSELLSISRTQFTKPYIRMNSKKNHAVMKYGLVHIRYSDKKMLIDMLNLIDSYRRPFCVGTQAVNEDTL